MQSVLEVQTSFDKKQMDACGMRCLTTNTLNFLTPTEINCFSEYFLFDNLDAPNKSIARGFIVIAVSTLTSGWEVIQNQAQEEFTFNDHLFFTFLLSFACFGFQSIFIENPVSKVRRSWLVDQFYW